MQPRVKWDEPPDFDAHETSEGSRAQRDGAAKYLPDWARSPIPSRIDGPFVVVRRIADSSDPTIVSSLHRALDGHIGGTVELADEGPLSVEDFRIAGETRLIRARTGVRPIVRIDGTGQEAVRNQAAVIVLKGKNVTLDGIDLIVDVRDLSRTQTALFLCAGSNLTVRNCSITILNQTAGTPFSIVRTETAGPRPTHVRFERCLIRGSFAESFPPERRAVRGGFAGFGDPGRRRPGCPIGGSGCRALLPYLFRAEPDGRARADHRLDEEGRRRDHQGRSRSERSARCSAACMGLASPACFARAIRFKRRASKSIGPARRTCSRAGRGSSPAVKTRL